MDLPPNVRPITDRHGTIRYRFRKVGFRSRYLTGEPGSPEFSRSYENCFDLSITPARGAKAPRRKVFSLAAYRGHPFVYFVGTRGNLVKIGTTVDLPARLKKLQTGSPYRLRVLACVAGDTALEAEYHAQFAEHRINGEWFRMSDAIRSEIRRLNSGGGAQPRVVQPLIQGKSCAISNA